MGNEEILGGLLTVHSRTAFSAGLYDMLNTGNLEPLEIYIQKTEKLVKRHNDNRKKGITPTYLIFTDILIIFIIRNKNK